MGANEWTDDAQRDYLQGMFPTYLAALENSAKVQLSRFWAQLNEGWFEHWSEVEKHNLVRGPDSPPWTAAQVKFLGEETYNTKERLKSWMRYREGRLRRRAARGAAGSSAPSHRGPHRRSLFRLLEKVAKRPFRAVEIYQKMFGGKIKEQVMARGYGLLNEEAEAARERAADEAAAWADDSILMTVLTEADTKIAAAVEEDLTFGRTKRMRSARMSLWRNTSMEMLAAELPEVVAAVHEKMTQLNLECAARGADANDTERSPEELQHGIDQLGSVFGTVHDSAMLESGWFGMTIMGGPMPRRGGAISIKTSCFGTTLLGSDFQSFNPNFEDIKVQFTRFLKRSFTHETRDSRGIVVLDVEPETLVDDDDLDDLIVLDPVVTATPAVSKPKRIRKKASAAEKRVAGAVLLRVAPLDLTALAVDVPDVDAPIPVFAPDAPGAGLPPFDPSFVVPEAFGSELYDMDASDYGGSSSASASVYGLVDMDAFDYGGSSSASTSAYGLASPSDFPWDNEDDGLPLSFDPTGTVAFDTSAAPPILEYRPHQHANDGGAMDDVALASATGSQPAVVRPAARPIHKNGAFQSDRQLGGSPGRSSGLRLPSFPPPSAYFQAFVKPPTTTSSAMSTAAQAIKPPPRFPPATPRLSGVAAFAAIVANASAPPPIVVAPPPVVVVVAPPPVVVVVAPPPVVVAPPPIVVAPPPIVVAPPPIVVVEPPVVAPPTVPGYPPSRPWIKPLVGHPLAPQKKKTAAVLAKEGKKAKLALAKETRLAKMADTKAKKAAAAALAASANADPSTSVTGGEQSAPSPPMTAAARAETKRLKAIETGHRKVREEMLRREKGIDEAEKKRKAAELAEKKRLHNPAGGADLYHTGSRPKRNPIRRLNFDDTVMPTQNKRKRAEDASAEADALILGRFAKQKQAAQAAEAAGPPTKKRRATKAK
ncbi:hypothetical protein DFH06DRAFT_1152344 [Mycena polygramma]|nr:hypothetical protein DFH06DRAFT_1152344 [Mycena polygramma]